MLAATALQTFVTLYEAWLERLRARRDAPPGRSKRAILAVEKGTPGERVFEEAFRAWGQ